MRSAPAAQATTLEIRELARLGELRDVLDIFNEIWGREEIPPLTVEVLRALTHAGNYVSGGFVGGRLESGLVGFFGRDEDGHFHLHSHILGVRPDSQLRGIGFALKQHQRSWALARDIEAIEWTFDPLVRRNAYFNICKLGADVAAFHVDFYGVMGDSINGDGASDRVLARWNLRSERAQRAAAGVDDEPDVDALLRSGRASVALREDGEGAPEVLSDSGEVVLCQVPKDIVALRRDRPAVAEAWREGLRATLGQALAQGRRTLGMTRSGWYVLGS